MSVAVLDAVDPDPPAGYELIIRRDGVVVATAEQVAGHWVLRMVEDGTVLFCDSGPEVVEEFYVRVQQARG
jgi:hypothetical protein